MKYYYLIASLPELSLDDPLPVVDVNKTLQFIHRNLEKDDQQLSKYLIYPNDNQNLINLIIEKHHNLPLPEFRTPALFSREELIHSMKTGNDLPDYMMEYLTKYKKRFDQLRLSMIEEYLWVGFYKEVAGLNHPFILEYFEFVKILRQIAASHNYDIIEDSVPTGLADNLVFRELGLGKPISILSKTYPYIEKLWNSLDSRDPVIIDRCMNAIRWDFIDNYEISTSFTNTQLFGWMLKLIHYTRWAGLAKEKGKIRFEKICNEAIDASRIAEIEEL